MFFISRRCVLFISVLINQNVLLRRLNLLENFIQTKLVHTLIGIKKQELEIEMSVGVLTIFSQVQKLFLK